MCMSESAIEHNNEMVSKHLNMLDMEMDIFIEHCFKDIKLVQSYWKRGIRTYREVENRIRCLAYNTGVEKSVIEEIVELVTDDVLSGEF